MKANNRSLQYSQIDFYLEKTQRQFATQIYSQDKFNCLKDNPQQVSVRLKQQQNQLKQSIREASRNNSSTFRRMAVQKDQPKQQQTTNSSVKIIDQDKDIHLTLLKTKFMLLKYENFNFVDFIINKFQTCMQKDIKDNYQYQSHSILRDPENVFNIVYQKRKQLSNYFNLLPNMPEVLNYIEELKKNRDINQNLSVDTAVEYVTKITNKFIQTCRK